ncbi:hypothetical protein F4859DRAFT_476582 [Xylaria cf. heliscus]|nr:hypothetical protein F4859DRAFT_476582 [Xylaria cf. heliscus]
MCIAGFCDVEEMERVYMARPCGVMIYTVGRTFPYTLRNKEVCGGTLDCRLERCCVNVMARLMLVGLCGLFLILPSLSVPILGFELIVRVSAAWGEDRNSKALGTSSIFAGRPSLVAYPIEQQRPKESHCMRHIMQGICGVKYSSRIETRLRTMTLEWGNYPYYREPGRTYHGVLVIGFLGRTDECLLARQKTKRLNMGGDGNPVRESCPSRWRRRSKQLVSRGTPTQHSQASYVRRTLPSDYLLWSRPSLEIGI